MGSLPMVVEKAREKNKSITLDNDIERQHASTIDISWGKPSNRYVDRFRDIDKLVVPRSHLRINSMQTSEINFQIPFEEFLRKNCDAKTVPPNTGRGSVIPWKGRRWACSLYVVNSPRKRQKTTTTWPAPWVEVRGKIRQRIDRRMLRHERDLALSQPRLIFTQNEPKLDKSNFARWIQFSQTLLKH